MMTQYRFLRLYSLLIPVLILFMSQFSFAQEKYDVLLRNGRIIDGTGNPWFRADIALQGDRIAAIGDLGKASADLELDATGLFICPGFIDPHSHAGPGLAHPNRSHAQPLLAQGVTTVMVNPDGGGPTDIEAQRKDLLEDGLGINVIQLVPHGSVRRIVMGAEDRLATPGEMQEMKELVRKGMLAGAYGLSSGPFYVPGSYSDTRELVELSKVAAEFGGVYTSHIRDESNYTVGVVAAVDEVIEISREAGLPGVVTHIKVLGPPVWGYSMAVIRRIEQARAQGLEVYADQYPYLASATGLDAALLPRWASAGGQEAFLARLEDKVLLDSIRNAMIENLARRGGPDRIQFRYFSPDTTVQGRTLLEVARGWDMDPIDASLKMIKKGRVGIVSFNMHEQDVHAFMQQPWTMTCSDGGYPTWGMGVPHPRGFSTFPRKIRKYVMDEKVIDLATAIRSMTSLPAQVFRVENRGVLRAGAIADIAVFDPETIRDKGSFTDPFQLAEGMVYVFVNGKVAVLNRDFTGEMAGKVLKKGEK